MEKPGPAPPMSSGVSSRSNLSFRPIAYSASEQSLNWPRDWKEDNVIKIGSELLKYGIETQGLELFDVVTALVSIQYVKGYPQNQGKNEIKTGGR